MEKLYYSISEVSEILGESVSLVRFWSNSFQKFIKPRRNGKGNRMYSGTDIETLKQIHYLVKDKGLTLDGAAQQLTAQKSSVEGRVKVLDSLKAMRTQLVQIKDSL